MKRAKEQAQAAQKKAELGVIQPTGAWKAPN
jgi:hypothetical protein